MQLMRQEQQNKYCKYQYYQHSIITVHHHHSHASGNDDGVSLLKDSCLRGNNVLVTMTLKNPKTMTPQTTCHGVFLDIFNTGVLITGASNIGKSELALNLIERGHRLIVDDHVIITHTEDYIMGSCPPTLQGFLAIRDIGIINITKLFGEQAVGQQKKLEFMIELTLSHPPALLTETALRGAITMQNFMGVVIPQQTILVKPNRNLTLLAETSVRLHQLRQSGYEASADLVAKQQALRDTVS